MVEKGYKRKVTHEKYDRQKPRKKSKWNGLLDKHIHEKFDEISIEEVQKEPEFYYKLDDEYFAMNVAHSMGPIVIGCFALFGLLLFVFTVSEHDSTFFIVISTCLLLIILCIIYYFTMPKKEKIFNRKDGLVTFPGFMWNKNYTMPFKELDFMYSSPSAQGQGAFRLQIVRPDKLFSLEFNELLGTCYEDLSFFTWYMDKNRPLPPGTAFDPYRQQDFERRKVEGFPEPLYQSFIPTDEATPEQQAEREKFWKEKHSRVKRGNVTERITPGPTE